MADFDQIRNELTELRQQIEQQRQESLLVHEAVRKTERELAEFQRIEDPDRQSELERLKELLRGLRLLDERAGGRLAALRANERELFEGFQTFTDPREGLRQLPDSHPILLFPLRLETRFKTDESGRPQLWVRVFPDTCLIDSFEPSLTEQEVENARAFWTAIGNAGDDEALARAAWRELAASHGSGRSGWIVRQSRQQSSPPDDLQTRRSAWSSAPRVDLLPERFVLVAYPAEGEPVVEISAPVHTPLVAGPDPNAPAWRQLKPVADTLQIPGELVWMFDFERALEAGMAFRINLTPDQAANGFERVVVLGVRMAETSETGQKNLERLLEHHLYSRQGLEILPQGTPTNNTEKGGSGYSFRDNPEATFEIFCRQMPQYEQKDDPLLRCDGQWIAELLGVHHEITQRLPNAGCRDQSEARAMQIALWPGTLGYMMKTLLAPIFSFEDVANTRAVFTRYISGRGPLPALRIGDQPYGILPTTAFNSVNWFGTGDQAGYLGRLYAIIKRIGDDWKSRLDQVSFIGKAGGDPHQILLDVLGLHPSSVEYYPLQADSVDQKYYELALMDVPMALSFLDQLPSEYPLDLLRNFGYSGEAIPDLLKKIFKARQTPLNGPLIDDRPLSEIEPIRRYAGDRNYIEWLVEAAQTGIERLQQEQGFDGGKKPVALLYLLLRHALQLSIHATGLRLQVEAGIVEDARSLLREPAFVHVREAEGSESHYAALFSPAERITGQPEILLGDHISKNVRTVDPELREQIEALERLSRVPTARLERLFAEHIDTCSHRLDAWKSGLLTLQLEEMRKRTVNSGVYLGAYGWLEPLRPKRKVLTPAELPEDLSEEINRHDTAPLLRDSTNQGLIHAPSLNHATTAAVLRNGYLANDGRLAVNLTSRRVRMALAVLEGMRNGQSLGALLGYQFERHVHDHGPLQVRELTYPLRREFPLAASQIAKTNNEVGEASEVTAAMNVVDGRKLLEHAESQKDFTYPFGLNTLPRITGAPETAITNALAHIRDLNDAVADLALAEGVHQAVLGNYDRSAGTLEAFAKGSYPPEPEVIRTPRSGIALTLRTAIHFSPAPPANPLSDIPLTPLAAAEPAVNAWLKDRLPDSSNVGCQVSFTDRANTKQTVFISQKDLGLHPIDLVYRIQAGADQALGDLDDRILQHLHTNHDPRHDRTIIIQYTERVPGKVNWFELQALLRSLRALIMASRPLQPGDMMRTNDAARENQAAISLPKDRMETARDDLQKELKELADALDDSDIAIDAALDEFVDIVGNLAAYRLPQTGTGFIYEWRAGTYSNLVQKIADRVKLWDDRYNRYIERIEDYDNNPPPVDERIARLQAAEILISTHLTTSVLSPEAYCLALDTKQAAFENKRDALRKLVDEPRDTLAQLLKDAQVLLTAAPPMADFDPDPLDFSENEAEISRFRNNLKEAVTRLEEEGTERVNRVTGLLTQHDSAAATAKVKLLLEAAKILFGEDFQMVPQFTLPAAAAVELANAWQHSKSGKLTEHLTDSTKGIGRDFPIDDWLHGVARVRDKMHHWENAILLGEALGAEKPPELTPLQLPYGPDEPWLALEIPEGYKIDSDRLLYTAHFAEPFDKTQPVCGMLVDEWTEVIPGTEETTGIAFHFDRPNSEPPQAWLLALPAVRDGAWSWEELLAAVNDALDTAKLRALEPVHLGDTAYSWLLPATVSSYTYPEISISNNLLRNVEIYSKTVKE